MSKSKSKSKKRKIVARWSDADRQAFADRNFVRSHTIPNKKRVAARRACRGRVSTD